MEFSDINMLFYIAANKGVENINLKITDDDRIFKFDTSLKLSAKDWDSEKQRPRNIYLKKHKEINNKLDRIKIGVISYINFQRVKKKSLTQSGIAKEIRRLYTEKNLVHSENSLLYFIQNYIGVKKQEIDITTYKRYNVFYNLIRRFEGYRMKHLMIKDVNSAFVHDFLCFGKEEEYSDSTIRRTIDFVKTILNFVERSGIRTAVMEVRVKKDKKQRELISLTESEILAIEKRQVSEELQAAKEWLLISCYTGQRFSDFIRFSVDSLQEIEGTMCIRFTQKKTRKNILLPLHPAVHNILKDNNGKFPPSMSMKNYNEQIKIIAKLAGLSRILIAKKRIGHRIKSLHIEKWQTLSSHIGRRSFATNFYGKIPTPLLMEATGHSTEEMFLQYINPVHYERVVQLGNYFNTLYQKE